MSWKEALFEEKNFWQIYIKARRVTGSKFNRNIVRILFSALIILFVFDWIWPNVIGFAGTELTGWVRDWAEVGVAFTTGILGFLVAGFSIFATITKNELFAALANIPYISNDGEKTELSQFKFVFFNFIIVFIHYISFLIFCLFIILLCSENGLFSKLIDSLFNSASGLTKWFGVVGVIVIITWFSTVVLMLKSFIWNLYQSVLLSIVAEAEIEERRKKNRMGTEH